MKQFDVTLAGEITMDLVMYGLPEEIPLERELLASGMAMTLGGSSAITAHNLSMLGSKTGLIPQLANDPFTELCVCGLREAGVDLSKAVAPKNGVGTGVTVLLQHEESRRAFTYPGTISTLKYDDLDIDYLTLGRHFHLSSYFLQAGLREDVPRLLATMREAGLTTSLDTNDDPEDDWSNIAEVIREVDLLMPNERELCRIANEPNVELAIKKLSKTVPSIVVKRGADGALAMHKGRCYTVPGVSMSIVDVVGAGDSFNAGFLHSFVHGHDIAECLRIGNLCGAYSTTGSGGTQAFRDRDRLLQFMEQHGISQQVLAAERN